MPDDLVKDAKRRARALRAAAVILPPAGRWFDLPARNMLSEAYGEAAAILEDASSHVVEPYPEDVA